MCPVPDASRPLAAKAVSALKGLKRAFYCSDVQSVHNWRKTNKQTKKQTCSLTERCEISWQLCCDDNRGMKDKKQIKKQAELSYKNNQRHQVETPRVNERGNSL